MPTLEWIGKDKVVNHHQEVPYRVLERQYSYDYPRRQSGGAESPAAPVRGQGEVHLYRSALQHWQRRLGVQR